MNLVVASVAICVALLVWWLAVRKLTARPWETSGTLDGRGTTATLGPAPQRIALWIFLGAVSSLFVLFITAYSMRMSSHPSKGVALGDWQPMPEPGILWLNLLFLVLASSGMQLARNAVARGQFALTRTGLLAGGAFAFAFLVGQWLAWQQLQADGYALNGNPANAFFYVLTGLHGLHLIGGLVVWGWTLSRLGRDGAGALSAVRLPVELCTVYWHFLLLVWLALFGLLLIT